MSLDAAIKAARRALPDHRLRIMMDWTSYENCAVELWYYDRGNHSAALTQHAVAKSLSGALRIAVRNAQQRLKDGG